MMRSELVSLRTPRLEDADDLFPLIHRSGVADTLLWNGPDSLADYRQGVEKMVALSGKGEWHIFTIVETSSGRPTGMIDIRSYEHEWCGDIGLWIGKPFHGKGYGTQAVNQIMAFGFETLKMQKIEASIFTGNWASRRIFEKNGFLLEGTRRCADRKYGRFVDEWQVGITRLDYFAGLGWIVHLCSRQAWQAAQERGAYTAESLEKEGFIHCSRPGQMLVVANAFYRGLSDLLLLWLDPARLQPELRWEAVEPQEFPHVFGPINLDCIQAAVPFAAGADGTFLELPLP